MFWCVRVTPEFAELMRVGGKGLSGLQCAPPSPPPAPFPPPVSQHQKPPRPVRTRHRSTAEMAADRRGTAPEEQEDLHSSDGDFSPERACQIPKRHARVTVKYNRKELQKRLDVEKWIDESLDQLYCGQVGPAPAPRLF